MKNKVAFDCVSQWEVCKEKTIGGVRGSDDRWRTGQGEGQGKGQRLGKVVFTHPTSLTGD